MVDLMRALSNPIDGAVLRAVVRHARVCPARA